MIWSKKCFFEKIAFFGSQMVQNGHKMAQKWVVGGAEGQFWVFKAPRPFGDGLKVILSKNFFFEKSRFLGPKWPKMVTKWAKNGSLGGAQRVNFGFLRLPDPSGMV